MELEQLKALLGISDNEAAQDAALKFIIDDVTETILNYCNLEELPPGLTNTAYRMAIDLYRHDRPGSEEAPIVVSTVSLGGTSTSFKYSSSALKGGLLKDYRGQLNRYRKLVW